MYTELDKVNDSPDILKYPLLVLAKLGFYSKIKTKRTVIVAILFVITSIFLECVALTQFLAVEDVFEFVYNLEAGVGFAQVPGKVIVLVYYQREFTLLIDNSEAFWTTDKCDANVKESLENIFKFNIRLQSVFFGSMVLSIVSLISSAVLTNALPTGVWHLDGYNLLYDVVFFSQVIIVPTVFMFQFAFDCAFLAFCTKMIVQFKILKYCLENTSLEKVNSPTEYASYCIDLKTYAKHHIYLLRFLKKLLDFYSPAAFVEYVTVIPVICSEMYVLLESDQMEMLIRPMVIFLTNVGILALYCFPADYAIEEAVDVSNSIYNSDWHLKYFSHLRKDVSYMMMRSQQPSKFTAGGLFNVNIRTIISVLRASYSACTVMRAIRRKT